MVLLTRKRQIAVKRESTEGTAETLGNADGAFDAFDPSHNWDPELHNRDAARKYRGQMKGVVGRVGGGYSWRTELKGSGSGATRPPWDASLACCGFTAYAVSSMTITITTAGTFNPMETITGSSSGATGRVVGECPAAAATKLIYFVPLTSAFNTDDVITGSVSASTAAVDNTANGSKGWEYTPDSDSDPSATVGLFEDGNMEPSRGCRGTFTIDLRSGDPLMISFDYSGVFVSETTQVMLSPTYPTTVVPILASGSVLYGARNDCTEVVSVAANNQVVPRPCATAARGVKSYRITDWAPQVALDPEAVLATTASLKAALLARRTVRFYAKAGTVGGNQIHIAAPSCSYAEVGPGDRDGMATRDIVLDALVTSTANGDDELQIAMI